MATQIIPFTEVERPLLNLPKGDPCLNVSEFYADTIQGEGIHIGHPAAFLRMKGCVMKCTFCDTQEVWRYGSYYPIFELLDLIEEYKLVEKFKEGQHLVLTGGSPLMQQNGIYKLLLGFEDRYKFRPYTEVETECVLMPDPYLQLYIDCWNNSPKLANSGVDFAWRYKPTVIGTMANLPNSWFKFVVSSHKDWKEIQEYYLDKKLIRKAQIILMPEGATRETLESNRRMVIDLAIRHGVRYLTREHIILWDKKIGV
jgi:7-carboxy-7-deazaguanine synthase